jgi:dTMP kinase
VLIALEGIDGAGKSTQAKLLLDWLEVSGRPTYLTKWNSSPLVKPAAKEAKKRRLLTPTIFALLEAADLADRYEHDIALQLSLGRVVVADRWVYTAFARGKARNLDAAWLRGVYAFAPKPDLCFYLRLPADVALDRILKQRQVKYYEAGMDLKISDDPAASFLEFQSDAIAAYNALEMVEEFTIIDALSSVDEQHCAIIAAIAEYEGLLAA